MQSCVDIVMSHLEIVQVIHQGADTNFKDWYPSFIAERTPLFKHPLVVLLGTSGSGISDFPGNFLSDATLGTNGNVSTQAVYWMLFMTSGIASWVVAFHRNHCDGLNLLSGSTTSCMIFGNQL